MLCGSDTCNAQGVLLWIVVRLHVFNACSCCVMLHANVSAYVGACVCVYVWVQLLCDVVCTCECMCMCMCGCVYTWVCVCMCVCVCVCLRVCEEGGEVRAQQFRR